MSLMATNYQRVALCEAACLTAAGDAGASWGTVRRRVPALTQTSDGSWQGRRLAGPSGLFAAALMVARDPWAAIAHLPDPPALAVCSSKGDPQVLLGPGPPDLLACQPGMLTSRLARELDIGIHLPCSVAAACSTGLYALMAVADEIERQRCQRGLVVAVDRSLTPLLVAGFNALGVTCRTRPPRAFAPSAEEATGFAPAEGAGSCALGPDGPWRLVAGVRCADAGHPTHFLDRDTLHATLQGLWRWVPNPDLIVAHATGTAAGDAYEAQVLAEGPWSDIPRLCCKPYLGHTLGASGLVELAVLCQVPARRIWQISLGFGGHCAAIAVQRSGN